VQWLTISVPSWTRHTTRPLTRLLTPVSQRATSQSATSQRAKSATDHGAGHAIVADHDPEERRKTTDGTGGMTGGIVVDPDHDPVAGVIVAVTAGVIVAATAGATVGVEAEAVGIGIGGGRGLRQRRKRPRIRKSSESARRWKPT